MQNILGPEGLCESSCSKCLEHDCCIPENQKEHAPQLEAEPVSKQEILDLSYRVLEIHVQALADLCAGSCTLCLNMMQNKLNMLNMYNIFKCVTYVRYVQYAQSVTYNKYFKFGKYAQFAY